MRLIVTWNCCLLDQLNICAVGWQLVSTFSRWRCWPSSWWYHCYLFSFSTTWIGNWWVSRRRNVNHVIDWPDLIRTLQVLFSTLCLVCTVCVTVRTFPHSFERFCCGVPQVQHAHFKIPPVHVIAGRDEVWGRRVLFTWYWVRIILNCQVQLSRK